jgi:hypothetical protein
LQHHWKERKRGGEKEKEKEEESLIGHDNNRTYLGGIKL